MELKVMVVPEASKEEIQYWGQRAQVYEKRLLTKADGFPASFTLRRIPAQERVVQEGGYTTHAHPTTEIGYVIRGRGVTYFEGLGEVETVAGSLLCIPAGTKHAAVSVEEELLIGVINVPPYEKPIGSQPG